MTISKRKRSQSNSQDDEGKELLNYFDDNSELSSEDKSLVSSKIPSHKTKTGNQQESLSDIGESGDSKVDRHGRLLGGREYCVPIFKLPTRGETLFMFSKDPAVLLGYRDSFKFLKKNTNLVKVNIDNTEKGYLVECKLLRATFRTREISVVTALSVFKQFGHRVVRKGKKEKDDYYTTEQREYASEDSKEYAGTTAAVADVEPVPSIPEIGRNNLNHELTCFDKSINPINQVYKAAISTRQFNSSIFRYRVSNPTKYDLLTNVYQIPKDKQIFEDNTASNDITIPK